MRRYLRNAPSLVVSLWAVSHGAVAAEATDAGQVKAGLERYLGTGAVTVGPSGSGYRVDIDVKALLRGLERFGVTLDPAVYSMTVTPQADGLWHVTSSGLPAISARHGEQISSIVTNGETFDGTFDPRIPSFTHWTGRYDSMSIGVAGKGAATQARELKQGEQTSDATPRGEGVVDGKLSRSNAGFSQDIAVDDPKTHVDISLRSGHTQDTTLVEGLHVRALADLWAFFVARPSADAVKADQGVLRTLLHQALPLFDRFSQDGHLEDLSIRSPIGPVGVQRFATHFDLHGLTADGAAAAALTAEGLTIPTERLPPWAPVLMPTGAALQVSVSGYRLDEAASTAIDEFDLDAPQPLSKATIDKLGPMVGSLDKTLVTIGESRLTSPTVDARFSGTVRLTQPKPEVSITVRATGLDQAIAAIQGKAARDGSAAQAIAMLILIKGYGKAAPDGSLTWTVASDPSGDVTVNGVALPGARKK